MDAEASTSEGLDAEELCEKPTVGTCREFVVEAPCTMHHVVET